MDEDMKRSAEPLKRPEQEPAAGSAGPDKTAAERTADIQARFNAQKAGGAKKGVVQVRSLHVRADHSATSQGVGGLVRGEEVDILETWTDGKDTWARIGPDQWAAMIYDGETYIKAE